VTGDLAYIAVTVSRLGCVQSAQTVWNGLMQCHNHHTHSVEREVFLLLAASLRILLMPAHRLSMPHDQSSQHRARKRNMGHQPSNSVSVGGFKVVGDARDQIVRVLLRNMLQTIKPVLLYLLRCTDGSTSATRTTSDEAFCSTIHLSENILLSHWQGTSGPEPLSKVSLTKDDVVSLLLTLQSIMKTAE
jgi:hypothetical protein